MSLALGATLGPYEIVARLGAGGMGEVYRARDRRLQREVAIKILKADGPTDEATRDRFAREARSVAGLSHPHIGAVYDVGVHDGIDYIVMELLEGDTLAARLTAGRLSVAETLRIAGQIGAALEAAHRAGIVHRDLKPGNIMLTRAGAKLLDFGLATRAAAATFPGGVAATTAASSSVPGTVVGTWQYMAPEQILGRPADARTDVFAFGVMLYEMLAGRRPFAGDSAPQIIAAILERDTPPLSTVAPDVPWALRRIVEKCLAKSADARWQSMHDLSDELRWVEEDLARPGEASPASVPRRHASVLWLMVTAALGLAAGMWLAPDRTPQSTAPVVRFAFAPSDLDTSGQSAPEVSPDGRQVAFVARPRSGGATSVFVHDLASESTRRLDATEGATYPFWSGDGQSVGFVASGRLMRIEIGGGSPRAIMDVQDVFLGAAWNRDDVIVASLRFGFFKVPAGGGTPIQITALDRSRQENSHRWPQFLPDGQRFVFVARSGRPDQSSAYVGFLDGRPPVRLMETSSQVRYSGSGHLLYVQDGTLMARVLSASSLTFGGDPKPIAHGLRGQGGTGLRARFSVSDAGVVVHQEMDEPRFQLRWYDRTGKLLGSLGAADAFSNFRIAPDGTRVAVDVDDNPRGGRSVWLVDVATGSRTRITFGESDDWQPIWSRDGRRILFGSYRNGPLDLYERPADGGTAAAVVFASESQKDPSDWSTDGRVVLVTENTTERRSDVVAYSVDSGQKTEIARTEALEVRGRFSPDERWVTYASDESGRLQIYVQPFPPTGAKWQITTTKNGGTEPRWRSDGREIYYLSPGEGVMAVPVETTPAVRPGAPALVIPWRAAVSSSGAEAFDVTQDGRRFLIRERVNEPDPAVPIHVILNWSAVFTSGRMR